ncbi:hypothetical protein Goshw_004279 [Gossypium schwendimanii]|uniref:RNase H type-1 domain-containing protein n=1 Tax=Gossypium schwendimanii TaxID=34291 RepID=A0A7J9L7V0_GOSSC|nr:hypothetical protein [Gossypium schwendimanii]
MDWSCLFGIISLRIWRNRNLFAFQGISWSIDEVLKVCLSTDGLVRNEECFAAVGRLVWDHNGGWIIRFCRYLGNCTVIEAKLQGILDGLKLILYRRFKRVSIQTDNLKAANVIQDGSSESSNSALVRRIHQLLKMVKQ